MRGFVSFPQPVREDKVRGKPERFAEHYAQATLFWRSQTPVEQAHIAAAFRFELTRVQTPAVRERIVSLLANVDSELAQKVSDGLGIQVPAPQPRVLGTPVRPEVEHSPALSLMARPGDGSIRGRRVALLIADGVDGNSLRAAHLALTKLQAVPRFVGSRLGAVQPVFGEPLHAEATLESMPGPLWDAVVVPDGKSAVTALGADAHALEFLRDQYRHCKPILALGAGRLLLDAADIPQGLPDGSRDPGIVLSAMKEGETAKAELGNADKQALEALEQTLVEFMKALSRHRHFERETDPPKV